MVGTHINSYSVLFSWSVQLYLEDSILIGYLKCFILTSRSRALWFGLSSDKAVDQLNVF